MRAAYERAEWPRVVAEGAPAAGRSVVALVRGDAVRGAIRDAIGAQARVVFCDLAMDLVRLATELGSRLVVAEPRDGGGDRTAPALSGLRLRSPRLRVVLYMSLTPADVHDAAEGFPAIVVLRHYDDIGKVLRAELAGATRDGSPGSLLEGTAALVPPLVRPFFTYCAWRAHRMRTAREAAAAVKIPPRTLSRWMRDAGLPTSKTVLEWYRLLHAAWHLEGGTRKRSAVAQRAGFRSGEALGHTLRQCVGISWAELRDAIGLGGLLGRFDALLRGPRTDSPEVESYRRDDTTS
jgi:hypothetical protein